MGLLDSLVGAALGGGQQQSGGLGGLLGGLLGGNSSAGAGGLAALIPVVAGMLANNGQNGGLAGLTEKFNQAGLGDVIGSWVGSGQNAPINADQLSQVLGSDTISDIASKLGMDSSQAGGLLAQVLPSIVDQLTPSGQAPAAGLGGAEDLMGMLGKMLQK
jgi:uncharacterized protein YidB (DUF937 family)